MTFGVMANNDVTFSDERQDYLLELFHHGMLFVRLETNDNNQLIT